MVVRANRESSGIGGHNLHLRLVRDDGLSSYPHPGLMPEFWEYPTVSMGLSRPLACTARGASG